MSSQFRYFVNLLLMTMVVTGISGCDSGDSSSKGTGDGPNPNPSPSPSPSLSYTISGTITGLTGSGLVLQNNGGDDLTIDADGDFEFDTSLTDGSDYKVTVLTHPTTPDQVCSINNSEGVLSGANVGNVEIFCQLDSVLCPAFDDILSVTTGEDGLNYEVGPIIALCNGWLLVSNKTDNTIELRNVYSRVTQSSFQLSARPYEMALDASLKSVFVTHGPATILSKVNLTTGKIDTIPLNDGAQSVATNNKGIVFANGNTDVAVNIIDGDTLTVAKRQLNVFGDYLHYNDATERLITSVYNYYFDATTNKLSLQGRSNGGGSGSDCDRVVVSPDGDHAAKPCGGGNGAGYTVFDFYSHDPTVVFGEWNTGAYPSGAAFGPGNHYILLTDRYEIQLFDVDTHALVSSYPASSCSYADTRRLAISRDGQSLYSVTHCSAATAKIKWSLYDTTQ